MVNELNLVYHKRTWVLPSDKSWPQKSVRIRLLLDQSNPLLGHLFLDQSNLPLGWTYLGRPPLTTRRRRQRRVGEEVWLTCYGGLVFTSKCHGGLPTSFVDELSAGNAIHATGNEAWRVTKCAKCLEGLIIGWMILVRVAPRRPKHILESLWHYAHFVTHLRSQNLNLAQMRKLDEERDTAARGLGFSVYYQLVTSLAKRQVTGAGFCPVLFRTRRTSRTGLHKFAQIPRVCSNFLRGFTKSPNLFKSTFLRVLMLCELASLISQGSTSLREWLLSLVKFFKIL